MSTLSPTRKHVYLFAALLASQALSFTLVGGALGLYLSVSFLGGSLFLLSLMQGREAVRAKSAHLRTIELLRQFREKQSKKEAEILTATERIARGEATIVSEIAEIVETLRAWDLAEEARRHAETEPGSDIMRESALAEERRAQQALSNLFSTILGSQADLARELSQLSRDLKTGESDV